eukprot:TRINITY_DN15191_c0_g1_i1.p1 TRINITY_DN15191_c0_g1~~TRINITY_DN15191_c0_g1_i1.p1  ORF type:complete len:700 (+),score=183.54 TRINITY_DN15191_c0_g1_i1:148-2100(+)
MYKESIEDPDTFWAKFAENFHWEKKWDKVRGEWNFKEGDKPISAKWFEGGTTNMCYNCIDKHVKDGKGDRIAYYYEPNDGEKDPRRSVTYAEVLKEVQLMANVLRKLGVKKGDRVAIYLPMILELPISMLACARIGAIHSVVFGGFAPESLSSRLIDSKAAVVITADGVNRGPKPLALKKVVDSAIKLTAEGSDHTVTDVVVVKRLGLPELVEWNDKIDHWYDEIKTTVEADCPVEWMEAEDPLFMLYTSGSTGTPKGVLHTTGGYMLGAWATVRYVFDLQEETDVFWCTADCGWITGHTYIAYGPMLNAATQVIFEGVPTYPDASRMWDIVDRYNVSIFYTAPTLIRALQSKGEEPVKKHKRTSLRLLGSVGEPINPSAWKWYNEVVGDSRCPIVDTWWQTETGSNMITSLPGAIPTKPGAASLPFFGVEPVIVKVETETLSEEERLKQVPTVLEGECEGYLCIKSPWPSMMRTLYNNHARYEKTYFNTCQGYYFTGDGCRRDADGYYWITGRVDDVINVSGHRIGTAEVEQVFCSHSGIAEAAAVGYPHAIKGEGIYVYVSPKQGIEGTPELAQELTTLVRSKIGAFAAPDVIHWAPDILPKTASGKIVRRVLRKIAAHQEEELGDMSTVNNGDVIVKKLVESRPAKK